MSEVTEACCDCSAPTESGIYVRREVAGRWGSVAICEACWSRLNPGRVAIRVLGSAAAPPEGDAGDSKSAKGPCDCYARPSVQHLPGCPARDSTPPSAMMLLRASSGRTQVLPGYPVAYSGHKVHRFAFDLDALRSVLDQVLELYVIVAVPTDGVGDGAS